MPIKLQEKRKPLLKFVLFIFIVFDLSVSFMHYYWSPVDGDFAPIVLPDPVYKPLLSDPLGIKPLIEGSRYIGPNRFFAHQTMISYFHYAPLYLQNFTDPIRSVYLSIALLKLIGHLGILLVFARLITGRFKPFDIDSLIVMTLTTIFFQSEGYEPSMGIINHCITYFCFYALPFLFTFIFLSPFFLHFYHEREIRYNYASAIAWILLAFYISLNGPLIPAFLLVGIPIFIYGLYAKGKKADRSILIFLLFTLTLSLYSMYIGRFNSENSAAYLPLWERYLRLPIGLAQTLTEKLGLPLLTICCFLNYFFIHKIVKSEDNKKVLALMKGVLVFSIIYVLLLPLGGYRSYRFFIIRSDTFLPVILLMVFVFSLSTLHIIKNLDGKMLRMTIPIWLLLIFIYTNSDLRFVKHNQPERKLIAEIAASDQKIVPVNDYQTIWTWDIILQPDDSRDVTALWKYYHITHEEKLFYQIKER